ncbi:MAG: type 1 glutamine amidotransferase domain-containing protein [Nitrososphaerota archaeon]|nr:type 1 glutamine amidotransferase [Candidatus Bathyarchaeota archaeon]MDW8048172.1 type 1 glutamine amidotransferase domain-containing protein [Nitrososphaerota archaeon]
MKKVLILVDEGFEDSELLYPYYRLQEAGYQVDIVGPKANETYRGKHGCPITANISAENVKVEEYEAVIIPGGHAPDRMRTKRQMVDIVREADRKGKVIAAICHGPQMLIEADIVRGRRATCYAAVTTDLKNAGARFEDKPVVVDGNIVTSRVPKDLPDFCREILRLLERGSEKRRG